MAGIKAQSYDPVAKSLHWLIFLLLAAQYTIGSIQPHITGRTKDESWVSWHLSVGAAILFFIVLRLIWKFFHPVSPHAGLPAWERAASEAVQWILYLLILVMTLLGWAASNAHGWDVHLFGVVTLPKISPTGSDWGHEAGDIHDVVLYVLLGFIVLHVGAAAYHYFVKRDDVVARMLPGRA